MPLPPFSDYDTIPFVTVWFYPRFATSMAATRVAVALTGGRALHRQAPGLVV